MSTMTITSMPPPRPPRIRRPSNDELPFFRLSGEQYDEMVRVGVLDENDRVELIGGLLYAKMAINPPHDATANAMTLALPRWLPAGWTPRCQSTLALPDGRPEPDVTVARGTPFSYSTRHPTPADVAMVVEVSDSTLAFDRTEKLTSYARAGIAEYWIVNLVDRQIEVYTQPVGDGYASRVIHAATDTIALPATLGGATIAVAELLPPAA